MRGHPRLGQLCKDDVLASRGQFARKAVVREIPVVQGTVHKRMKHFTCANYGEEYERLGTSRYKYPTRKHRDEIIHPHPHPSSCVWIHTRPLPNLLSEIVKRHAGAGKKAEDRRPHAAASGSQARRSCNVQARLASSGTTHHLILATACMVLLSAMFVLTIPHAFQC